MQLVEVEQNNSLLSRKILTVQKPLFLIGKYPQVWQVFTEFMDKANDGMDIIT
jgi:hypothetical protein